MNKIAKNILIGSIITIGGAVATQNIVAGLLYHEYKIKTYYEKDDKSRKNQDFMVLIHGIYGKSSDMESIAQKFKNDYRIINIQYPTTKETAEEIVERYIKPNIEDVNGQIYADNLHRKIENQYYEIDENGKRKEKTNDENAQKNGYKVIIAGAGGAAHLPGMIAAKTLVPVLGVPVKSSILSGVDSLYSIVQMPKGIPVGTLAIGPAGAANAGLLAAQILAGWDDAFFAR